MAAPIKIAGPFSAEMYGTDENLICLAGNHARSRVRARAGPC
jgi:hypothetical protein